MDTFWTTRSPALVSDDRRSTVAALRLAGGDEDSREQTFDRIRAQLETPPTGLRVGITGDLAVDADLNDQAESDLRRAEMLSLPALLLLLVLIFRGPVAAVLPLVIGVLAILGSFAVLRGLSVVTDISVFSVNVVTMLGLGLAVDYSLFIVSRYREELQGRRGPDAGGEHDTADRGTHRGHVGADRRHLSGVPDAVPSGLPEIDGSRRRRRRPHRAGRLVDGPSRAAGHPRAIA